jgi:hypothetical protein
MRAADELNSFRISPQSAEGLTHFAATWALVGGGSLCASRRCIAGLLDESNSRIARADSPSCLPKKINFCQVENFVSASARDSFDHEQTKARGLFQSDCRNARLRCFHRCKRGATSRSEDRQCNEGVLPLHCAARGSTRARGISAAPANASPAPTC